MKQKALKMIEELVSEGRIDDDLGEWITERLNAVSERSDEPPAPGDGPKG